MNKIINNKKIIIIVVNIVLLIIVAVAIIIFCTQNKTEKTSTKTEISKKENIEEIEKEPIIVELENIENIEELEKIDEIVEKEEKNTDSKKVDNSMPYYIKVNYGAQVVTIYKKDEQSEYTIPVKAMVCSTGVYTPTSGVYSIPARWEWLGLQGDVYGHYCTQIKGNILFHSVPYLSKYDNGSLEYWEYDKLGTYASAGCVRLTVRDAKWIFDNCARGTNVEFYSSSDPGPLGKPSAKKISSYPEEIRNWDPTDPDSDNPWHTYSENQVQNTEENTNNKIENIEVQNNTIENKEEKSKENTIENEITNNVVNEITNTIVNQNIVSNEVVNTIKSENTIVNETTDILNNKNSENSNTLNEIKN